MSLSDPDGFSLATLALFAAIIALAGFVHGTLGLGFPLVATPLLALIVDVRSAILITLLPTVAVNVASIVRGGRWGESIGRFWPLAAFAVLGSALGTRVLIVADPAPFKLLLAALILVYLTGGRAHRLKLRAVTRHRRLSMLVFGLAAGFAAGTTNVMVPILIIYTLELGLARTAMVQVFNMCFLAGKVSQLGVFAGSGVLSVDVVVGTLPLAGVAVAALLVGIVLRKRIPTALYRRIVRRVLALLAVVLVAQYAVQA